MYILYSITFNLIVKKDGINYKIKCDAIQYVQAITRGVQIKLSKETVKVPYLTIKEFMKKVDTDEFIQCHRMYVINKKHVQSFDVVNRIITMEDGGQVEIGVTYKDKIKDFINEN